MAVTEYNSTDGSAPALTGEASKLVDVLYAFLVTGFGSKAGAGWTRPYTGTNAASFRQGAGNQYYLNVNDNGPGAGTYKEARIVGYETMSAYATGTNLFPTAAQQTNGVFARKSATADATARAWYAIADARTFYLFIASGDTASNYSVIGFGDIYSFKAGDVGHTFIGGRHTENSNTMSGAAEPLASQVSLGSTLGTSMYLARDTANGVGAVAARIIGNWSFCTGPSSEAANPGTLAYKNVSDNRIYVSPMLMHIAVGGNHYRGRMRGLWHFGHPTSNCSDDDTMTGTGDLAGKTFRMKKTTSTNGVTVVETSSTWDTN